MMSKSKYPIILPHLLKPKDIESEKTSQKDPSLHKIPQKTVKQGGITTIAKGKARITQRALNSIAQRVYIAKKTMPNKRPAKRTFQSFFPASTKVSFKKLLPVKTLFLTMRKA